VDPLTFSISTTPRGKGRPRATVRGGHAKIYTDAQTRAYEAMIKRVASFVMGSRPPLSGALSVSMRFRMPIPKSATKALKAAMAAGEVAHISKPDASNLVKAAEDALNGVMFHDDSQVVRLFVSKVYSDQPGLDVRIEALEPQGLAA
jgi:Holliday junction resolvase RusA-like endonuclease